MHHLAGIRLKLQKCQVSACRRMPLPHIRRLTGDQNMRNLGIQITQVRYTRRVTGERGREEEGEMEGERKVWGRRRGKYELR